MKGTMMTIRTRINPGIVAAVGCLGAAALVAAACADGGGALTRPSASANPAGLTTSALSLPSPRGGTLTVTKECSQYTGLAGSFCTITSSNVGAIEVGSKVIYGQAAGPAGLDSDIVLDPPGPGNNTAVGHCTLDGATGHGLCTFSGGTGKFQWFHASANVSYLGGPNFAWNGTYNFSPHD